MTDRGILFQPAMVRALIAGTKTQTRRAIKPQPIGTPWFWAGDEVDPEPMWFDGYETGREPCGAAEREVNDPMRLRYAVGDRLWVRESIDKMSERGDAEIGYRADWPGDSRGLGWRPSIHMPRWASRLTLTVTEVRVQRLQDITDVDALAEGIVEQVPTAADEEWNRLHCEEEGYPYEPLRSVWLAPGTRQGFGARPNDPQWGVTPANAYEFLWRAINGGDSWAENPWVVAITFTVRQENIDHG